MALLIRGGWLLADDPSTVERRDVLVEGDRIAAVAPELASSPDAQVLDAADHLVLPGLVNAHMHGHNNLLKCSGDNWTLEETLNHFFALNGNRTVEDQYLSAASGAVEMLKSGCTATYDLFAAAPVLTDEGVSGPTVTLPARSAMILVP